MMVQLAFVGGLVRSELIAVESKGKIELKLYKFETILFLEQQYYYGTLGIIADVEFCFAVNRLATHGIGLINTILFKCKRFSS